jgi:hypothetical protein
MASVAWFAQVGDTRKVAAQRNVRLARQDKKVAMQSPAARARKAVISLSMRACACYARQGNIKLLLVRRIALLQTLGTLLLSPAPQHKKRVLKVRTSRAPARTHASPVVLDSSPQQLETDVKRVMLAKQPFGVKISAHPSTACHH